MEKRLVKVVDMMVEDRFNEFLVKLNLDEKKLDELSIAEDFRLTKITTSFQVLQKINKLTVSEIESIINKEVCDFYNSYLADYATFEKLTSNLMGKSFNCGAAVSVCIGGNIYGIEIG